MGRVALTGGAYTTRSLIAGAQRCVNLFAEKNPEGAVSPYTYYPTPGLRPLSTPPVTGAGRGLFRASSGALYGVVGQTLYRISSNWSWTAMGSLTAPLTTPVSMSDNSLTLMAVDGTDAGYTVNLLTQAFATMADPAFYGGTRVEFLDTFFVLNKPGTGQFYSSLALSTAFDATYFATKIGYPDPLVSVFVTHREIWLIGRDTTEIWVNSGAAAFPFEIMNGVFIQHGCAAPYSVAGLGDSVFWLAQDKTGQGVVLFGSGYQTKAISTPAIAYAIAQYDTIADAVGFCYQMEQHEFYVLTFPSADATWVFDITTGEWHEWVWTDGNGAEHRHRAGCHASAYGENLVLDWETGALSALDLYTYTDAGAPIVRRRGFPHMVADGTRVIYPKFTADMEPGNAPGTSDALGPQIYLRWSDTRGASWGSPIANGLGGAGNYLNVLDFSRLGMARDRVFELFWSSPVRTALNGAFVDARPLGS